MPSSIKLIENDVINKTVAKEVFEAIFDGGVNPEAYVEEHGLKMDNDTDGLKKIIEEVVANNPKALPIIRVETRSNWSFGRSDYEGTQGKANPQMINKILNEILNK